MNNAHQNARHETSKRTKDSKIRVLVVDDDVKILRFLRSSLTLAGYDVATVTSGEEALKLVESDKPDIMLLDLFMPVMDGFEVLERIRSASELPVIAFSAHISAADRALCLGANRFLSKPFRPDELIKVINSLF
jgi:two-component system, OmpR family, KDP operon response regulator KdpE